MRSLLAIGAFAVTLGLLGCSSGGGGSGGGGGTTGGASNKMTCEWLSGPDNCWQKAVDEAYADCALPDAGEGYFGDDYLSCSYPNGDSDVYGGAGNGHDDFYIQATRGGSVCFTFQAPTPTVAGAPAKWSLTTKSGVVTYENTPDGMSVQCPNGSKFSASGLEVINVLSCPMKQYPDGSSAIPIPGFLVSLPHFALYPPSSASTGDSLTRCTCAPQEYDGGGLPPPEPGCPG